MKRIVEVAIGLPISKTFHYLIPEKMRDVIQVGMRVLVPFKGRKVTGFTIDLVDHPPEGLGEKLKEIERLLDEAPIIDPSMLRFYQWISDYYIYPLGEVIKTGLPPGLQLKSELLLSLTQEGRDVLLQGDLDLIQEKVFREIDRCCRAPLKAVVKTFSGEISRPQIFAWKKKGLLNIDAGIESKEVKPKFERVIQYQGGEPVKLRSRKQGEILKWLEEKREVSYSELANKFKSPSRILQSFQAAGAISVISREICRTPLVQPGFKPYPKPEPTPDQDGNIK